MESVIVKAKRPIIEDGVIKSSGEEFIVPKEKAKIYVALGLVDIVKDVKEKDKQVTEYQDKMIGDGDIKEKTTKRKKRKKN